MITRMRIASASGGHLLRHGFALLAMAVALGGCPRAHPGDDLNLDAESTLNIVNHHWGDVDVYVIHDGQRQRIGSVTAAAEENFALSPSLTKGGGTLQLQAHAVGSTGAISSESFNVRPGGMQITWTLESNLTRATLAIY